MRKTAVVFFIIIIMLVMSGCFIAGCTSLPFGDNGTPAPAVVQKKANAGLAGMNNPDASRQPAQRYSFDDAVRNILSSDTFDDSNNIAANESGGNVSIANNIVEKHIKYVHGADLDEKGDARSWAFIIDHRDVFSIVTYTNRVISISDTPGSYAGTEIDTGQILSPRRLFEKNRDVLSGTTTNRDLSLEGGNYTISITNLGLNRVYIFDARTGVLIS